MALSLISCGCRQPPMVATQLVAATVHAAPPLLVSFSWLKPQTPRMQVSSRRRGSLAIAACSALDSSNDAQIEEAMIDLKLPRRSLLVQFSCDACGHRSSRLINRAAYERGTVFVQCAGCLVYHKLVDNLQLVVEYNLLEEDSGAEAMG